MSHPTGRAACPLITYQGVLWRVEKPSDDINSCLFLMNKKGLIKIHSTLFSRTGLGQFSNFPVHCTRWDKVHCTTPVAVVVGKRWDELHPISKSKDLKFWGHCCIIFNARRHWTVICCSSTWKTLSSSSFKGTVAWNVFWLFDQVQEAPLEPEFFLVLVKICRRTVSSLLCLSAYSSSTAKLPLLYSPSTIIFFTSFLRVNYLWRIRRRFCINKTTLKSPSTLKDSANSLNMIKYFWSILWQR